jgi:hypothetical protein
MKNNMLTTASFRCSEGCTFQAGRIPPGGSAFLAGLTLTEDLLRIEAYDGLVRGELEYAMSARNSTLTPPAHHHISILMSGAGRFVVCRDCHLSFEFPSGAHYDTLLKRLESHPCSVPLPKNDALVASKSPR